MCRFKSFDDLQLGNFEFQIGLTVKTVGIRQQGPGLLFLRGNIEIMDQLKLIFIRHEGCEMSGIEIEDTIPQLGGLRCNDIGQMKPFIF